MFIVFECDWDWTVGIDWNKDVKGIRLGWFAIHLLSIKFTKFNELIGKQYHQDIINKELYSESMFWTIDELNEQIKSLLSPENQTTSGALAFAISSRVMRILKLIKFKEKNIK